MNPNSPETEEKFKNVVEAYETLGDANKRKEFDLKIKKTGTGRNGENAVAAEERNRIFAGNTIEIGEEIE